MSCGAKKDERERKEEWKVESKIDKGIGRFTNKIL